ncbi:MAG TPA: hypothetical protein VMV92_16320 [Streptosporangiaceae bacterium]|nr:hypothetical protein [Streptosporangiaceae bacterium]
MPDDAATSHDDANDESKGLPTPPEADPDGLPVDDGDSCSASVPSQAAGPEETQEEPSSKRAAGEESPRSADEQPELADMSPERIAEQMLALERRRDAQGNVETRPPDGETITLRSITVAEEGYSQDHQLSVDQALTSGGGVCDA